MNTRKNEFNSNLLYHGFFISFHLASNRKRSLTDRESDSVPADAPSAPSKRRRTVKMTEDGPVRFPIIVKTRMHTSRMRTGRSLTVFGGGVYLPGPGGGVPAWSRGGCTCLVPGGCTCLVPVGVYLPGPRGGVPAWSGGGVPAWSQGGVPGPGGWCTWSGGCTCLVLKGGCTCLVLGGVPAWSQGGVYLHGHGGGVPAWSRGVCLVRYSPPPR